MSELISGKEALIALANGEEVQYVSSGMAATKYWSDSENTKNFTIHDFYSGSWAFRLKPRTITINGIKVPAPFEPNCMEDFYVIDGTRSQGWINGNHANPSLSIGNPKWRTEEEIKQVVAALRSVFGKK